MVDPALTGLGLVEDKSTEFQIIINFKECMPTLSQLTAHFLFSPNSTSLIHASCPFQVNNNSYIMQYC